MRHLAALLLLVAGCGPPSEPGTEPLRATLVVPSPDERELNLELARLLSQTARISSGPPSELTVKPSKRFETDEGTDAQIAARDGDALLIDRGRADGLRIGTRFQAFRHERGGSLTVLGVIEVSAVEERWAHASAVRGGHGIAPGVHLRSPTYDDEDQKVFVFFRPPSQQSVEATRRLGARVDEKVSIETDFLVLPPGFTEGLDPDEDVALRKARQFGVIELTADEAALYLGLSN